MLSGVSRVTMMFHLVKVNSAFTCGAKILLKIHSHIFSEYCEELESPPQGRLVGENYYRWRGC